MSKKQSNPEPPPGHMRPSPPPPPPPRKAGVGGMPDKLLLSGMMKIAGAVALCYMCIEVIGLPEQLAAMVMLTVGVAIGLSEADIGGES